MVAVYTPKKWDIVLLSLPENPGFDGCLMVCEEIKEWGVMGYVQTLGGRYKKGGSAYYRATWEEMRFTGGSVAQYISEKED